MDTRSPHGAASPTTPVSLASLLIALWLLTGPFAYAGAPSLDGDFVQGSLVQGRVPPGTEVEFEGTPVRVSPQGVFIIGFGRDEPRSVELVTRAPDGAEHRRVLEVARRDYRIQRIDGLPPKKVNPSAEHLARIQRESAMIRAVRAKDEARLDFADGFIWPARGRVSGVYGSQRILNGEPRRPHFGVDIAAPTGTPVIAPAPGIVTLAYPDMYFSGGTLVIDHGHGLSSAFLHLSKILVEEGMRVARGDLVAEIGGTGRATGPHLDWRINLFDRRLDPAMLVGPMPK